MENHDLPQKARDESIPTENSAESDVESSELIAVSEHYLFSAPLPPPQVLAEYERVMPGLSERIVRMAEKEQEERFSIAKENVGLVKRAQWLGFTFGTATLGTSLYLITHGEPIGSVATLVTGLATLIGTFFYGSKK